jgi:hypothetical protein
MTTSEYVKEILEIRKEIQENDISPLFDENAANEVAGLVSGSFTYSLYEALLVNYYDMNAITDHLDRLYDNDEHFSLIYFVFILANVVSAVGYDGSIYELSITDNRNISLEQISIDFKETFSKLLLENEYSVFAPGEAEQIFRNDIIDELCAKYGWHYTKQR